MGKPAEDFVMSENFVYVPCRLVQPPAALRYSPSPTSLCGNTAGTDGNVDFGVLKVLDDTKQALTLKNKGKYEIAYRWVAALAACSVRARCHPLPSSVSQPVHGWNLFPCWLPHSLGKHKIRALVPQIF